MLAEPHLKFRDHLNDLAILMKRLMTQQKHDHALITRLEHIRSEVVKTQSNSSLIEKELASLIDEQR